MLLHLLKRDLRHTRWYLLVMLVALGALCAFPSLVYGRVGEPFADSRAMNTFMIILAAYMGANLALVWRLVAEDAPLRETAFWRTRALAPGVVLGAKLVYAAVFIVVVPALLTLPAGWGLEASLWAKGAARVALVQGLLAGFGLAVAMLSRRMLVGLAVVIGAYVLLAASSAPILDGVSRRGNEVELYFGHALMVTRNGLAVVLVAGAVAWAVWRAYRRAEQRNGLIVIAGAVVAAIAVLFSWPWALLPSAWTAPGPMRAEVRASAAGELRLGLSEAGTNTVKGSVWGTVSREAKDETLWRVERMEVALSYAAGGRQMVYPAGHSATGMLGHGPAALAGADKQGFHRLGGHSPTFPVWLRGVTAERPVTVSARLVIQEGSLAGLAAPAQVGAEVGEEGNRLRITDVAVKGAHVGLTIVDQRPARASAGLGGSWPKVGWRYVLIHEATGAVAVGGGTVSTRMFDVFYKSTTVARIMFPRSEFGRLSDDEVRAWVAGARLVRVTYQPTDVFAVEFGPMALPEAH